MTKRNPKSNMTPQEPCDRLEVHGNYAGLARAAWAIAEERNRELDEIERLLDRGENESAIALMRRYIRPNKKPVRGEDHGSRQQGEVA